MNDDKIVDLYWIRSEDAITETSIKYGKYCYGIAYNILADAEDAEDAAASEEAEEDAAEPQNRLFIQSGRSPPRMALPGLAEQPVSASSAAVSPE